MILGLFQPDSVRDLHTVGVSVDLYCNRAGNGLKLTRAPIVRNGVYVAGDEGRFHGLVGFIKILLSSSLYPFECGNLFLTIVRALYSLCLCTFIVWRSNSVFPLSSHLLTWYSKYIFGFRGFMGWCCCFFGQVQIFSLPTPIRM